MDDLRIFLTHPDPSDPLWWGALAVGLVTLAGLWDLALPRVSAFVESTATKVDDRILAAVRPLGRLLRLVASAIRFVLPLARLTQPAPPAPPGPYRDAYDDVGDEPADDRGSAVMRVAVLSIFATTALVAACGGSSTAHGRLNRLTDFADPTSLLAVNVCRGLQDAAVERAETRAEAEAEVASIRRNCDHAHRLFKTAAANQLTAREAVAAFDDGRITLPEALNAIDEAEASYRTARDFLRGLMARGERDQ